MAGLQSSSSAKEVVLTRRLFRTKPSHNDMKPVQLTIDSQIFFASALFHQYKIIEKSFCIPPSRFQKKKKKE